MLMGLNHKQFLLMKQGTKTIEIRLNDEKRSLLEVGSLITFVDAKTQEKLNVTVDKIYNFKTFSALYRQFYGLKVGSAADDSLETMVNDTYAIYSPEQEEKYGVLAIKISLNFLACLNWKIAQLSQKNATIIANDWHYPAAYSFYDMQADPEDYQEIITPQLRKDNYYQATSNLQLCGFFVIEPVDQQKGIYELGLGMAPKLTGKGLGKYFVKLIISYLRNNFQVNEIILDVADFNLRAQKVYRALGFKSFRKYQQQTNGGTYLFVEMRKKY